jgi:RNA recognition motif-containing protein
MFGFLKQLFGGKPASAGIGGKGDGRNVEIYVGNLSYDMKDRQLREAFAKYGAVKEARVVENRHNKRSKGFGFVVMPNRPEAEAAIKALHDRDVMGRRLRVNEAKNKSRE